MSAKHCTATLTSCAVCATHNPTRCGSEHLTWRGLRAARCARAAAAAQTLTHPRRPPGDCMYKHAWLPRPDTAAPPSVVVLPGPCMLLSCSAAKCPANEAPSTAIHTGGAEKVEGVPHLQGRAGGDCCSRQPVRGTGAIWPFFSLTYHAACLGLLVTRDDGHEHYSGTLRLCARAQGRTITLAST